MMDIATKKAFYIGDWRIEPSVNRVSRQGEVVQLEPKVMRVLVVLAGRAGHVVTKDELMESVWAGSVVVDAVLARAISTLRKALDDDALDPTLIETIRKVGYRLIAPVHDDRPVSPTARASLAQLPGSVEPPRRGRTRRLGIAAGVAIVLFLGSLLLLDREPLDARGYATPIPLTSYPGSEIKPAMSPDGNQVAFAWRGTAQDNWDIYIRTLDADTPRRFTHDAAIDVSPAWSPDGRHLAFVRLESDASCVIYIKPVQGDTATRLADCGLGTFAHLDWSPDGQWLALDVIRASGAPVGISLFSTTTSAHRQVTAPPSDMLGDLDPRFSPDGRRLAFTRVASDGTRDLHVTTLPAGPIRRLTYDGWHIDGFDWEADGDGLLFSSNRGSAYGLWRVPVTGGAPEPMPIRDHSIHRPTLAPRHNRLVYERLASDVNIWLGALHPDATAPPTRLIASTQWEAHPQFSPDGEAIAFTSNRSGHYEVWRTDRNGEHPVQLTHFEGAYTGTPRWSPDGRWLAFMSRADEQADIFIIPAEGGIPRQLTTASSDDLLPHWSQQEASIYFTSNRSGTWEVWTVALDGSPPVQVTHQGGFGAMESPDGTYLYYTKQGSRGIWRKARLEEEETLILADLPSALWGNWHVTNTGIYFLQRSGNTSYLAYYDLTTALVERVFMPQKGLSYLEPAVSISSNEQWLLYTQVDHFEKDLMLLELSP